MADLWRIEMLGGLRVVGTDRVITRFRSRQTGALLAYLAFYLHRAHPREVLMEIIWPGEELDSARDRLRVALSSLRRQLEPPGVPSGAVIVADGRSVRLNPAAVSTDVAAFEAAAAAARRAGGAGERVQRIMEALDLYRGELLPGYYEAWILPEQQRLADLSFHAARELIQHQEQSGDLSSALDLAGRAVAADLLREEAHQELIRLCLRAGQPVRARQQFQELERLLREEVGEGPSYTTRQLFQVTEPQPEVSAREALDPRCGREEKQPPAPLSSFTAERPQPEVLTPRAEPGFANRLPLQLTRFFGREAELAQLCDLLLGQPIGSRDSGLGAEPVLSETRVPRPDTRLLTLTGPGGSGKTRLAVEVAGRLVATKQGAVWWVPLVDLAEPGLIADAVRDAMRLPRSPQVPALEQVVEALIERRQPALLVLDNFEHLVEGGALVLRELLERAPTLQCLVTSRQILNLTGEREFPVAPLSVPAGLEAPAELTQFASVRLFVDRAQAVRPDFQVTDYNAPAVTELCHRLEGIPLAIELAAARIQMLTPVQMLPMLARRFELLVSRQRDRPARHRTLHTAIEWSYRLLTPELQRFFALLSVFRGGWTLEAAAAVCGGEGDGLGVLSVGCTGSGDRTDATGPTDPASAPATQDLTPNTQHLTPTLEALTQLQQNSLIVAEESGEGMRYRMLETLREYAEQQLTPGEREALARRHAVYFRSFAEAAEPDIRGGRSKETQDRLQREHDNLRAALDWLMGRGFVSEGIRLALALVPFWQDRYHFAEGLSRLVALLALTNASDHSKGRSRLIHYAGTFAWEQTDYETACNLFRQNLPLLDELGDKPRRAQTLRLLGHIAMDHQGDCQMARALYEDSLASFRAAEDPTGITGALYSLGVTALAGGDSRTARAYWGESLSVCREIGAPREIGYALEPLARINYQQGNVAEACACLRERIAIQKELVRQQDLPLPADESRPWITVGPDGRAVRRLWEESLAIERELGAEHLTAWRFLDLGEMATMQGDFPAARSILEECVAVFRDLEFRQLMAKAKRMLAAVVRRQGDYPAARALLQESLALWRVIRVQQGMAEVTSELAILASDEGDSRNAGRLIEESLTLMRGLDRRAWLARVLHHRGVIARRDGELERARRLFEENLTFYRAMESQSEIAITLADLAKVRTASGDRAAARSCFEESLAIRQARWEQPGVAECLEGLAAVDIQESGHGCVKPERAARMFGAAAAIREAIGAPLPSAERPKYERQVARVRTAVGEASFAMAWAEGCSTPQNEIIAAILDEGSND